MTVSCLTAEVPTGLWQLKPSRQTSRGSLPPSRSRLPYSMQPSPIAVPELLRVSLLRRLPPLNPYPAKERLATMTIEATIQNNSSKANTHRLSDRSGSANLRRSWQRQLGRIPPDSSAHVPEPGRRPRPDARSRSDRRRESACMCGGGSPPISSRSSMSRSWHSCR